MFKKIILILFSFIFLFSFKLVQANVFINEVQISGVNTDDEFIELYNSSSSIIDLTGWYINKKSSTGNETNLVSKSRLENKSIPANSYFLLAKENGYIGTVPPDVFWPNSYSLSSNNSILLYKGNETDKDQINWESIEEGKSFQKQSNNFWKEGTPTPGKQNETIVSPPTSISGGGGSPPPAPLESKSKIVEAPKIKTKITAKNIVFKGIPVSFSASTIGYSNEPVTYGKYFWNFGDGDWKETKVNDMSNLTHTFFYEGEYTVSLEYFTNYYSDTPDATDKIIIKVLETDVSISKVGDEKDFFIEISNNTEHSADLSKWILASSEKSFIIPRNTILEAKKKMILSPHITGFSILDKNTLKLSNPQWETVFTYASPIKTIAKRSSSTKITMADDINKNLVKNDFLDTEIKIPSDALTAGVLKSSSNISDSQVDSNYWVWGLFALLTAGASGSYFIRRYNRSPSIDDRKGNNFEILEG